MRSRLLVAAVGVPALLYVVLWGPPLLMLAALALLAGIGGGELYHCAGGERDPFLAVAAVFIPCMTVGWYYSRPQYVGVWFILSTLAVFTYAICRGGAVWGRRHRIRIFFVHTDLWLRRQPGIPVATLYPELRMRHLRLLHRPCHGTA